MNEREKNSLSETASTARMIHGAVRTGKAISGAAKGAAMGGPYGAAISAVLSSKKHIGAILAVVIVLLMLPVLFVLMLPSVIFGGLTSPNSSTNPNQPILNDTPAIIETTNNLAFAINQILGEGIDDVTTRIVADFAATSGDNYEIINPYEGNLISNTNSFLGQYCAAKNLDWRSISPSDLEAMLRAGKSHLYTYTSKTETRWVDADDPNTPDVVEQDSELWYIYTIVYNGERYFADTIFQLSDEQKVLADDYAWNLSLFLGDGMPVHRARLTELLGDAAVFAPPQNAYLRPASVAALAMNCEELLDYTELMPMYLRAPSAERNKKLMEAAKNDK